MGPAPAGYRSGMGPAPDADHALGLELQLEELVEQRRRAEVQGRAEDAAALEPEIARITDELAAAAERAAAAVPRPATIQAPTAG